VKVDVSNAVKAFAADVTITRRAAPTFVLGRKVDGAETTLVIKGVVYPLSGRDYDVMPEGLVDKAEFKLVTTETVYTADGAADRLPDLISWNGRSYVAHALGEWTQHGGFQELVLVLE